MATLFHHYSLSIIRYSLLVSFFLALFVSPYLSFAQDESSLSDRGPVTEEEAYFWGEEEEIYSATKYIKRLHEAPAIATVITAKQIRNMGAQNLLDVLEIVPGLGVYKNFVDDETVEVRGIKSSNAEKILFMIDGHRINDPFFGGVLKIYSDLFVENIKRVEVIRGPGSALYGANAFVAVVNIITKSAASISGLEITGGVGSFNTQNYTVLFGTETGGGVEITGAINYYNTGGPQLTVDEDAATITDNALGTNVSLAPGKTNDWKEKYDINLSLTKGNLTLKGKMADKKLGPYIGVGYALDNEGVQKLKELFGELSYRNYFTPEISLDLKGYIDQFELEQAWKVFPEGFAGVYPYGMRGTPQLKDQTTGTEVQFDYLALKDHAIVAGVMYEHIKQFDVIASANFDSSTGAPLTGGFRDTTGTLNFNQEVTRDVYALYLQDEWRIIDPVTLTAGVRYDSYSDFGDTINPRAGLIWKIIDNGELKMLYGEAFRSPNFQELYNINNPVVLGNKDLKPEKIKTYEIGAGYRFSKILSADINYFHNEIQNIITTTPQPSGGFGYDNFGGVNTDGVEMVLKASLDRDTYAFTNYSWQHARDKETGIALHDVPKHRGNIGMNFGVTKYLNVNSTLRWWGKRRRATGDTREAMPAIALTDLTLIGKNFYESTEIRASIFNLFDQRYADPAPANKVKNDFPRAGISFMLELRLRFE